MQFLYEYFDYMEFYEITEFASNFNCLASIHRPNHILTKLFPLFVLIVFYYFTFPKF